MQLGKKLYKIELLCPFNFYFFIEGSLEPTATDFKPAGPINKNEIARRVVSFQSLKTSFNENQK